MTTQAIISRRAFAGGTVLAAAAAAFPSLGAQGKPEKTKISISVSGKAAFYHLPLTISEQLGYFKAEGLDLEISDISGAAHAAQTVAGSSPDVHAGGFEHTINLQAKNQMFRAIVLQSRAPQIAFGISTRALPFFKSIADLKGKKVGVVAPGSSTSMLASLVLSRGGLQASDVNFVAVGTTAGALSAMRSGQVDAMSYTDPVMTMLEQNGDVKIISDTRTLKGTQEVFGGSMPAACLYASADFIQKNPNTCQALADAIVHGLKWLQTAGPGDILKTVPESYLFGDRALYLASFNKVRESISPDGIIPEDGPRTALRALMSFDPAIKANRIDLGKTYTNEFARRAKERFKA